VKDLPGAARLFSVNAIWRATGLDSAGRSLVRALDSPHEDLRTIAAMFLVQGGKRAIPLLRESLHKPQHKPESLALVLAIIGDIGGSELEPQLRRFSDDPDPLVAKAARDALAVVASQRTPS
jgi:hypothetical protein